VLWLTEKEAKNGDNFERFWARSCTLLLTSSSFSRVYSSVAAFTVPNASTRSSTKLAAEGGRRDFLGAAAAAAGMAAFAQPALADRDYANVGLLGGDKVVDVNNANVRVYLKMPGLYPNLAGKIVSNGPYNSVGDLYNIPGLTGKDKELLKKYENRFVAQKPSADYVIDRINNGL
jgi:photosystem II PsbU protein